MPKQLLLLLIAAMLIACNRDDTAPQGPPLAQAQATAASEVDRGETPVVVFRRTTGEAVGLQEWRSLAIERVTAQTLPVRLQSIGVLERFIFEQIGE